MVKSVAGSGWEVMTSGTWVLDEDREEWSEIHFGGRSDRITVKLSVGDGKEKKLEVYS